MQLNVPDYVLLIFIVIVTLAIIIQDLVKSSNKQVTKAKEDILTILAENNAYTSFELSVKIKELRNAKRLIGYGTIFFALDELRKENKIEKDYDKIKDRMIFKLKSNIEAKLGG